MRPPKPHKVGSIPTVPERYKNTYVLWPPSRQSCTLHQPLRATAAAGAGLAERGRPRVTLRGTHARPGVPMQPMCGGSDGLT